MFSYVWLVHTTLDALQLDDLLDAVEAPERGALGVRLADGGVAVAHQALRSRESGERGHGAAGLVADSGAVLQ